ncbi:hypothetical protein DD237_002789 [Peronospora effusa]|uniref:Rab-GAP TBC domain-containing protein n=1 Tax=Peronospora effusa TaxID=542832 RepID=A0A3R7XC23_9STRA|nr:hypothetical protein DD237_002789 [Peronospora effusa]
MQQSRKDWFVTSGARELKSRSTLEYQDYLHLSKSCTSSQFEEDLHQIELDLARTNESIRLFLLPQDERETVQEISKDAEDTEDLETHVMEQFVPVLRNILTAYSVRNPRVGFVQGHADVLCFLLGHVNDKRDEEETFWVYANVIERVFPEDFFARTPKLHGFQVDCQLFHEMIVRKLVPLHPILAKVKMLSSHFLPSWSCQIDLPLVTTLLSCKWFVSLWVGEMPLPVLYKVWDTMLGEDDGTILHLLVALHFFKLAMDNILLYMEKEQWDSSYIYKIILDQCRNAAELSPQTLLQQAHTLYGVKADYVEDMRAALRRLPLLRKAEFIVLAKQTHFDQLEMERLQDEFAFLRYQRKTHCRSKLRGLRQDDIESILAREFNTWPVKIHEPIYRYLKPDGYGNVSYYSLIQFLSVASRGTPEEKADLLFQIPNQQCREHLDQQGIQQLADLLCCLLANRMVADAGGNQVHELRQREHGGFISSAANSPLLRRHFRKKLLSLATSDGQLQLAQWLEYALGDSEIAQLIACDDTKCHSGRMKSRSLSLRNMTMIQPTLTRALSDSLLHHTQHPSQHTLSKASARQTREHAPDANSYGVNAAPFLKASGLTENACTGKRQITLLSNKMQKKFKASWPSAEDEVRNLFGESSKATYTGSPYVFWCQCTVS